MKPSCHLLWLSCGIALCGLAATSQAQAQPVSDTTLPVNSIVTQQGNISTITGGTRAGRNLFHSFSQFSIPTKGVAYFNNAFDIQNIISRVTGASISNIDGLIRANGTANLFLINPNGIIFGPTASLKIGGSFVASTASNLKFADGTVFSANAPQTTPLLTISVPLGLQLGGNQGRIEVQGDGQGIRTTTDLIDTKVGLHVEPNQTLALVGGDVTLWGGTLKTAGGRIELGSVAGPSLVSLTPIDKGWALGYSGVPTFGDIKLSQRGSVDASGAGGGDIQVRGAHVTLTDGSKITDNTLRSESGGSLNLRASDSLQVMGGSSLSAETYSQGHAGNLSVNASNSVQVVGGGILSARSFGAGAPGELTITTGKLIVSDGGFVTIDTISQGQGGNLSVNASDSVQVMGRDSRLTAQPLYGAGAAGNLTIATGKLIVSEGAQVVTDTYGQGRGGNLSVNASDSVQVMGRTPDNRASPSHLSARTYGTGAAGNLTIATGKLIVSKGAEVVTATYGQGKGGNLSVNASDSVELMGTGKSGDGSYQPTNLSASTYDTGAGGELTIATGKLIVRDGAHVGTFANGRGQAGNLSVNASDSVQVLGRSADGAPSGLFAEPTLPGSRGAGGNLTITTGKLIVSSGAAIGTTTQSREQGGTLSVKASDSVELVGTGKSADGSYQPSNLSAETFGAGAAGDLRIETGRLTVRDGAKVSVGSLGVGSGAAGKLEVRASTIRLDNQGKIIATTDSGQGGNIKLKPQNFLLLRNHSSISTTAGTAQAGGNGGNISINTPFIVAVPSEDSNISANAFKGNGGEVRINASGIFGTQFRSQPTPDSDITASSTGGGVNGVVNINTLGINPSLGLVNLPVVPVDVTGLIAQGCPADVGPRASKFVVTGRGGLPPTPREALRSEPALVDLGTTVQGQENRASAATSTNPTNSVEPAELVEAQGWVTNAKGEVVLTATAPTVTPNIPWLTPTTCHTQ